MKTKLTLSVDPALVVRAKRAARLRRVPLSRLVEEHFAAVTSPASQPGGDAFLRRWRGAVAVTPPAGDDARLAAIQAKHLR